MNLRTLAESDLAITMEDSINGFGWPVTLTDPDGVSVNATATSNDISLMIDPSTGQFVTGSQATASLRISTLFAAGITTLPYGEQSKSKKPWLIAFNDINGRPYTFRVFSGEQDRTLGVLVLLLEAWK